MMRATKRYIIEIFVLVELLSFAAHAMPEINDAVFVALCLTAVACALWSLEAMVMVSMAELVIGSKGYLFAADIAGSEVPIRIVLWIVVMGVWCARFTLEVVKEKGAGEQWEAVKNFFSAPLGKMICAFGTVIAAGMLWGGLRNQADNVFFDSNQWLFGLYLLPLVTSVKNRESFSKLWYVLKVAISAVMIKTFVVFFIFSHNFYWIMQPLYRWIRDSGVGEITYFADNFYRVFFQSHIWVLLGFFMALGYAYGGIRSRPSAWKTGFMLVASAAVLLLSFSRSFWVGGVVGIMSFFVVVKLVFQDSMRVVGFWALRLTAIGVAAAVGVYGLGALPPHVSGADMGRLIEDRLTVIEAAGSSRMNLLGPLISASMNHPLIGSGFGSVVTYRSVDPRILSETPVQSGVYTTFAFEWGYLDLWLKIGLVGLAVYGWLLVSFVHALHTIIRKERSAKPDGDAPIAAGMLLALGALIAVHIFTPYLNHPLGIGFLMLVALWLFIQTKEYKPVHR